MNEIHPLNALVDRVGLVIGVAGHLRSLICHCGESRRQTVAFVNRTQLKRIAEEQCLKGMISYIAHYTSVCVNGQTIMVDGG